MGLSQHQTLSVLSQHHILWVLSQHHASLVLSQHQTCYVTTFHETFRRIIMWAMDRRGSTRTVKEQSRLRDLNTGSYNMITSEKAINEANNKYEWKNKEHQLKPSKNHWQIENNQRTTIYYVIWTSLCNVFHILSATLFSKFSQRKLNYTSIIFDKCSFHILSAVFFQYLSATFATHLEYI